MIRLMMKRLVRAAELKNDDVSFTYFPRLFRFRSKHHPPPLLRYCIIHPIAIVFCQVFSRYADE